MECSEEDESSSNSLRKKKSFEKGGGDYLVEGCRTVFSFLEIKQKGGLLLLLMLLACHMGIHLLQKEEKGEPFSTAAALSGGLMEARGCLASSCVRG